MHATRILVVEDDPAIRRGLVDALVFSGYGVTEACDGASAVRAATDGAFDLVLLDVMLPGAMDGFEILRRLRDAWATLPIILVTARGAEADRVRGLSMGADDYVVKPFSARELLARVEAVLRRSPQRAAAASTVTCLKGRASINLARREVRGRNGDLTALSEREAAILAYLASHRGRAIDRKELLQNVWGLNPRGIETRTVDMHVARLRDKLAQAMGDGEAVRANVIVTVRGKGYMLGDDVEVA